MQPTAQEKLCPMERALNVAALAVLTGFHAATWLLVPGITQWATGHVVIWREGLLFAQVGLLAVWGSQVRWPMVFRLPVAGALAYAMVRTYYPDYPAVMRPPFGIPGVTGPDPSQLAMTLAAVQFAIILVPLMLIRVAGLRVRQMKGIASTERPFRFSVRTLLVLTTLAALSVWLGRMFRDWLVPQLVVPPHLAIALVGIPAAATTLLVVWATLRPGRLWGRLGYSVLLVPVIGAAAPVLSGHDDELRYWMEWTAVIAGVTLVSLLVVRGCGYRLCRRMPEIHRGKFAGDGAKQVTPHTLDAEFSSAVPKDDAEGLAAREGNSTENTAETPVFRPVAPLETRAAGNSGDSGTNGDACASNKCASQVRLDE